jgi:hypothetical protein
MPAGRVKTIVYSSVSATVPDAGTVLGILRTARAHNARHGVRGVLLLADRMYMQVLEGPAEAVDRLMDNIQRDPRHSCVVPWLVEDAPDHAAMFADWTMAFARVGAVGDGTDAGLSPIDRSPLHAILAAYPERSASRILRGFLQANERRLDRGSH